VSYWEYLKIDLKSAPPGADDVHLLNDAGSEGWELVAILSNGVAYLKRPLAGSSTAHEARPSAPRPYRRRTST
jgi:hypothetical protein